MTPEEAIKLIAEHDRAVTRLTKTQSGAAERAIKAVAKAETALFTALVGRKPTLEEDKALFNATA